MRNYLPREWLKSSSLSVRLAAFAATPILLPFVWSIFSPGKLDLVLWLVLSLACVLSVYGVYTACQRFVLLPLHVLHNELRSLAIGDLSPRQIPSAYSNDAFAAMHEQLALARARMVFEQGQAKTQLDSKNWLQTGLDNMSSGVMLLDAELKITYFNHALRKVLEAEKSLAKEPLLGLSFEQLCGDSSSLQLLLHQLQTTQQLDLVLGKQVFHIIINPIKDTSGFVLAYVAEWRDRTEEREIEHQVAHVIEAASQGHLNARLDLADLHGFFSQLAQGINNLLLSYSMTFADMSEGFRRLAAGDLSLDVPQRYEGELAEAIDNANQTIAHLREMLCAIKAISEVINTTTHELVLGNQALSFRTEQQRSSLEQTTTSIEQLLDIVKRNAERAIAANELAGRAQNVAERGGRVVNLVVDKMGGIQKASSRIADIVGVIDGLAFQTNILALNAAVEAARAGAQGRGFAVVAAEVRNLAQRSAAAAREINSLISDSVEQVQLGTRLVDQAGQTMSQIVLSTQEVAGLMTEIAQASREQSTGIEHVSLAVLHMETITQQNMTLVDTAARAAENLEKQTQNLEHAMSVFQLPQTEIRFIAESQSDTPVVDA